MIAIVLVIVLLFTGILLLNNYKNKKKLEQGNPYGTDDLKQETIDLLDNENYQDIIIPEDLAEKIENKETLTVYYFSPVCGACMQATPELMAAVNEVDAEVKKMNVYEFPDEFAKYDVKGTPTLVHYEDGEEVERIYGSADKDTYAAFLKEFAVK